jgi:hypothetical protein
MEAGGATKRQESLASGERHGDNRAGRRATALPTTLILPRKKGRAVLTGPPPQRSTVQTR